MALTRTEALRQLLEQLEEISAKLNRSRVVSSGSRQVIVDLNGVIAKLQELLSELESQTAVLATIKTDTASISAEDFSTEATLSSLLTEATFTAEDFASQTTLALLAGIDFANESGGNLSTIAAIDYFLANGTDAADLLSELQSIDQNWNLLSVNNVALLALVDFQEDTRDNTQEIEDLLGTNPADTANRTLLIKELMDRGQWGAVWKYHTQYEVTGIGGGTTAVIDIRTPSGEWCEIDSIGIIVTGTRTSLMLAMVDATGIFTFQRFSVGTPFWAPLPTSIRTSNEQPLRWIVLGADTTTRIYVIVGLKCRDNTAMAISTLASTATISVLADYNGAAGTFTVPT